MLLLKNCFHILTLDENDNEYKNQDILIEGNKISKISPSISLTQEESEKTEAIDCSKYLVLPGFVNTHHHFYQTMTRNLKGAQNAKLFDWLVYLYPIWEKLITPEGVYYSTLLGIAELLKTGATTTTDHLYLYPKNFENILEVQFEAASKIGIRFSPSRGCMTLGRSKGGLPPDNIVQTPDEVLKDMQRVIEKFHDSSQEAMRKVILAPCSPFSVDETVMIESAKLARQYGVILHTHLAETEDEEQFCLEKYKRTPLQLMQDRGWTGKHIFFAHGIWFKDSELDVLAQTQTGIAHCPTSNMRLGSGIARITEMLKKNIRIGLAVDGSASNDSSDMLGEVRNAMLLQRVKYGADAMTARQAIKLAVTGGHNLLNFANIGRIQEGYVADLAIFDMHQLQYAGALTDPVAALIFAGFKHETTFTIVNGEIVVRDGKIVNFDENEIFSKINELTRYLV